MVRYATDQVTAIGIDISKNNFHLIGLDGAGNTVFGIVSKRRDRKAALKLLKRVMKRVPGEFLLSLQIALIS